MCIRDRDKEIRKDGEGEVLFDIRHLTHTFETEDGKTFDALKLSLIHI